MRARLAVVLVAYNRPKSLIRLFDSVVVARADEKVDLIISIDKSDIIDQMLDAVDLKRWDKGEVIVRSFEERLGLRKHIIACGDLTEQYEAVVVLEDDIVVSESFISYALKAMEFVENDDAVAGISLYAPGVNEMCELPFVPKKNSFDNYYLQSAQSWGQCWTRKMWQEFKGWYESRTVALEVSNDMPSRIYSWPESSWKKYKMKYLVEKNKTYFYPYFSFSTNCSDIGEHNKFITPMYQVPLITAVYSFHFGTRNECICYDVFFERLGLTYKEEPVCLDLYGTKVVSDSRFLLSSKKIAAPVLSRFGLGYRPHEDNFIKASYGDDIYLYDLQGKEEIHFKGALIEFKLANYHALMSWKHSFVYSIFVFFIRLKKKFSKLFSF